MSERRRIDWAALPTGHVSPPWLWRALAAGVAGAAALVAVLHLLSQAVLS